MAAGRLFGAGAVMALALGFGPGSETGELQLVAPAHAVVGRPLTPVSVAGVARRTTRRAVYTTAAVAATTPAVTTVVVTSPTSADCVKVIESNGAVTYRCP